MIETIGDLLQLLHRWPSAKRILIAHRGESTQLSTVTRQEGDVLVIESIHRHAEAQENPAKDDSANTTTTATDPDTIEAIEQCDRILTLCDEVDSDSNGIDFVTEIAEKVQSVRDWVEEKNHVTAKQLAALNGWERGVEKWAH